MRNLLIFAVDEQCPRCGAIWPAGGDEPPCSSCGYDDDQDFDLDDFEIEEP